MVMIHLIEKPSVTRAEIDQCLSFDDKLWQSNFVHDLSLLRRIFVSNSTITWDTIVGVVAALAPDSLARSEIEARLKIIFGDDQILTNMDDCVQKATIQASAHFHFIKASCHASYHSSINLV